MSECPYCDFDRLASHYHCGNCGEVTGMMGHWSGAIGDFSCTPVKRWRSKARAERRASTS